MIKKIISGFLCVLFVVVANAQPFASDIAAFKKQDAIDAPPKNAILFVGSSSFTKWKDVQSYFPGHTIINRGFGGSVLNDVIRYEKDIIFPYQPKQIVIYCGENDVASSDTVSGKIVLARFKKLYTDIRQQLPATSIVFISLKPCPSRWQMRDRMIDANKRIRKYLKKKKNTSFVSVWKAMLDADGKPIAGIFIEDRLHMNAKGYAIWQKILEPYLQK
ncbi:SGNH/GDSL hydrolase family protein [Ferruginibacter profundus]